MSWWWIIVAFVLGAAFGAVLMAICFANNATQSGKKWWEE